MNPALKGLIEIIKGLPERKDKRLEAFEAVQAHVELFHPDPEEVEELLPSLFSTEMLNDSEIQHYVTYLRKAVHRWAQKRLMGWPAEQDEDEAFENWLARKE
jgi:hypothetical protein